MDIRNELVDEVRRYFVGPYEDDEKLRDYPEEIYISGLLFPRGSGQEQEDMDESRIETSSDEDTAVHNENMHGRAWLLQNSIGIKCSLKPDAEDITMEVEYARYEWKDDRWHRRTTGLRRFPVDLDSETSCHEIHDGHGNLESKLTCIVNNSSDTSRQYKVLSVFLSNEMDQAGDGGGSGTKSGFRDKKIVKNQRIIFQPTIRIHDAQGSGAFRGIETEGTETFVTPEEASLDLLFRNKQVFAQGYGCAAVWDLKNKIPLFVQTEIVPVHDSKNFQFSSKTDKDRPGEIDMAKLDRADSPAKALEILEPIVSKYQKWIGHVLEQAGSIDRANTSRVNIANENYKNCLKALDRIKDGLHLLEDGARPEIFESFKITNRAMLYQRARYNFAIGVSKGRRMGKNPDVFTEGKYFWRPFQIAFLLMNLRGIGDVQSDNGKRQRDIVDLLWFPTGGGKTEAYFALAAFSMVLRRIRGAGTEGGGLGVSVVMRYTLRLLTLQQFERASTLICALEKIRRGNTGRLGREPFLIGLWVGYSVTPTYAKSSEESIKRLVRGEKPESGSPAQLNFCPWCGADIRCDRHQNNYHFDKVTGWTLIHCRNPGCDFYSQNDHDIQQALPIVTVDEDIYRRCPSFLISTVDKFARLPWKPETSSLFGIVDRKCPRCGFFGFSTDHPARHRGEQKPTKSIGLLDGPDLIIQDELHLITGPLGTMVGLYETAVEYLSSFSSGTGPKIVVSTATIRGVEDQTRKLYNRAHLETFPPPAIDYGDSFFWWYSKDPGRRYVGLSYSHRSMKFALGRLYSSLLQRVFEIRETAGDDGMVDPYWTLVAYFNSIRELGGAIRLAEDDVRSNIRKMIGILDFHSEFPGRPLDRPDELTSRRTGVEIKELRRRLEQGVDSGDHIDMLLATNMISVGIDMERLGLMVIAGQPKSMSEYIQATGRIGRREDIPGLVFTLYNPYKPRDLSHYEDFAGIHTTLQKSVEPAGLTPFSDKAMERALHAVFLSLVRLTVENLSRNKDARRFTRGNPRVDRLLRAIVDRYVSVQNLDRSNPDYQAAETALLQFQDNWEQFIRKSSSDGHAVFYSDNSKYGRYGTPKERILMVDFAEKEIMREKSGFPKETPGSLRDVETEAGLFYD